MLKHFMQSAGTNFIVLLISMFQGVLIARVLHAEGKGVIAVYLSVYSIIYAFSNLGIRQSSAFFLSKENMKVSDIAGVHFFGIVLAFLLSTIGMFIAFYYQGILNIEIFTYFILMLPFVLYTTYTTSFALSNRWIDKLNIVGLITAVGFFALLSYFYLLLDHQKVEYYFLAQLLASILTALYVYSWAHKIEGYTYKISNISTLLSNSKKIIFKGITYALPLFIYGINYKIDILILHQMVSRSEIGIYSVGVTFAELVWQLPTILSMIIFSYSVSDKDSKLFSRKLWEKNKKIMIVLVPILLAYGMVVQYIIPLLFGDEFAHSHMITFLLLPGTYAIVAFNILNADMAARGFPAVALSIFSMGAILNIILNYLLIPKFGIDGAAIASSVSYISSSAYFAWRYYDLTFRKEQV